MKTPRMYCPECDRMTEQRVELLNKNKPDKGAMYVCNACGETTGVVEDEKVLLRLQEMLSAVK